MLLPPLPLDRTSNLPIPTQLYLALRVAILDGRLRPGTRLPSTRALAASLLIARSGAVEAFERLAAEGYLISRAGDGTRVAEQVTAARQRHQSEPRPKLSRIAQDLMQVPHGLSLGRLRPFKLEVPALDAVPLALWARFLRSSCLNSHPRDLDAGDPLGLPRLRELLAERLYRMRSIVCDPAQIAIVSSSQQALDLVCRMLIEPGDAVWTEDPGYNGIRGACLASGGRVIPVRVDALGLDIAHGERIAPRARLAYVTPSHQFPTGVTMRLERRLALLDWARRKHAIVIEDDYDNEFQFEGPRQAALYSLTSQARVIYIGTFSKALFPAVRLAYAVLPRGLIAPFRAVRHFADGFPASLVQQAAARFLAEGHLDRHLRQVLALCRERRAALLEAAQRHLRGLADLTLASAGLHAVAWLPPSASDRRAQQAAASAGIDVIAMSTFAVNKPQRAGLILGFAPFAPRHLDSAMRQLAATLAG